MRATFLLLYYFFLILFRKPTRPSLPLKKFFLPLRLSCKESSTFSPSPSSIVFTTPSVPLLGDRNLRKRGCNRPTRCSEPLRYKVGGPSKVCARLCGMGPPGVETARVFGDWRSVANHSVFFLDFFIAQKFKKHFRYSSFANCLENKSRICTQYL